MIFMISVLWFKYELAIEAFESFEMKGIMGFGRKIQCSKIWILIAE